MQTERVHLLATPLFLATAPRNHVSQSWVATAQQQQLRLCDTLEAIADSLPANVDTLKCMAAAKALGPLTRDVHRYEEEILFPCLERDADTTPGLMETLTRLKFEHCEDECFAEEVTDTLVRLAAGDKTINVEATGYMLRGFFEAMRRHIAFEREHLLPRLTSASV
ncbi:hemerythrin domain-containing protein [Rhizobium sp. CFBP 8762]|uniref:hemerythrin domain-containing protein n=1 Tax=Rhizobium sp. CFBP 8762 TaxID=2775279 RepID=UPI00177D3C6A|nr:hemerythrin domain-containing protein [Rhizobium sp. CFBP 8762]MBD8554723.1 hemerythrin domain-containing protein [Rhizobium sp. CFBP 8762]